MSKKVMEWTAERVASESRRVVDQMRQVSRKIDTNKNKAKDLKNEYEALQDRLMNLNSEEGPTLFEEEEEDEE